MTQTTPIESARTALEVLEILSKQEGMTLSELQEILERPHSTTHDYLMTLRHSGYVIKKNDRYQVSTRCLSIGIKVRSNMELFQLAKPEIDSLAEKTDEHVSLMIEERGLGVLLYISRGERALELGVSEGHRMALPTNAPGKAILAHMPEEKAERLLDKHGLPKITEATITDRNELYDQLKTVRSRGFAFDFGERVAGVRAVSVPITTQTGVHGALTVSGTASRMNEERLSEELPALLSESADVVEVQYRLRRE